MYFELSAFLANLEPKKLSTFSSSVLNCSINSFYVLTLLEKCLILRSLECTEHSFLYNSNNIFKHNLKFLGDVNKNSVQCPLQSSISDARYIGDLKTEHFNSPRRAKRHISMIQKYTKEQKEHIKKLKKENEKLITGMNRVEDILAHLCEKNLLNQERQETLMV